MRDLHYVDRETFKYLLYMQDEDISPLWDEWTIDERHIFLQLNKDKVLSQIKNYPNRMLGWFYYGTLNTKGEWYEHI